MVGRSLGGTVRAVRLVLEVFRKELLAIGKMVFSGRRLCGERWFKAFGMSHFESPVNFIRGDVVETFSLVLFRQAFPIEFCRLKHAEGPHHVRTGESERVLYAAVHMALGCKMDHSVNLFFLHQGVNRIEIADVRLYEAIIGSVLDILEICQIAGISQFVDIDNPAVRIFVHEKTHDMASDETCAASDDYCLVIHSKWVKFLQI